MNVEDRITAVVAKLKAAGKPLEEVEYSPWIAKVEDGFGRRLPDSFRSLVTRYVYAEFDIGGVTVFSNLNDGSHMDITIAPIADPYMSFWLIAHNFMQFGRPATGSYDPVCFDFSRARREPPVVVLDHEDILLERTKVRAMQLADSFLKLIEKGY